MSNLRKFCGTILVTILLTTCVLAGQMPTPCPPPEPGQMPTPCEAGQAAKQLAPAADPGQTSTPPSPYAVDIVSVAEGAMNVLQSMLAVF